MLNDDHDDISDDDDDHDDCEEEKKDVPVGGLGAVVRDSIQLGREKVEMGGLKRRKGKKGGVWRWMGVVFLLRK